MMDFEDIPDNCFISHAYEDKVALDHFLKLLPVRIKPTIFNPIIVTADEMVSSKLIQKLRDCDALIYLEGGHSDKSFWVAFELNYALLLKKQVFSYNISSGSLNRDESLPRKFPVYASYKRDRYMPVAPILEFLRTERHFDLFEDTFLDPGVNWKEKIVNGLKERLDSGGYMVLFWSPATALSEWVKNEIEIVKNHPVAFSHTIVAVLTEPGYRRLEEAAPQFIESGQVIKLYKNKPGRVNSQKKGLPGWLDQNRLDDLVVLIHWLVIRNNSNNFSLQRFPDLPARPTVKMPTL